MARSVDCNVILKYCEILDEFIKVRVFSEEDIGELLHVKSIPNKAAYQQLVVNACVVDFHEQVLPLFKKLGRVYKPSALEELLYQICVEVNPHLEIHQVSLPLEGNNPSSKKIHLLDTPDLSNQKESRRNLARIEQELRRSIIGQQHAVDAVLRSIRKAAAGLKNPNRPVGTYLLVGQTGTGKTELAKMTSRHVFGGTGEMVRIDCSEFALPHEYAKLIGAPPGYVGHNDGGQLTDSMKDRKSGVVLFDEIEKAHRKVHNLLLQVMDEGSISDNKGNPVSFRNSLILLTSNVGVEQIQAVKNRVGFDRGQRGSVNSEDFRAATFEALHEEFRPEFLNRLDGVIVFNPLQIPDCIQIAKLQLSNVASWLERTGIQLTTTPGVARRIAQLGFHPDYGARELRRIIQTNIEDPLSESILAGDFSPGDHVRVTVRRGQFGFVRASRTRSNSRPAIEAPVEPRPETVASGEKIR